MQIFQTFPLTQISYFWSKTIDFRLSVIQYACMSFVWQKKVFQETWTRFGAGRKISTTSHQKVRFWAAKVSMKLIWNICSWAKKDSITDTHESDENWGTRFLGKLIWEDFFRTKILGFFHGFFLSFGFCSAEASRKPFSGLGKLETPERSGGGAKRSRSGLEHSNFLRSAPKSFSGTNYFFCSRKVFEITSKESMYSQKVFNEKIRKNSSFKKFSGFGACIRTSWQKVSVVWSANFSFRVFASHQQLKVNIFGKRFLLFWNLVLFWKFVKVWMVSWKLSKIEPQIFKNLKSSWHNSWNVRAL